MKKPVEKEEVQISLKNLKAGSEEQVISALESLEQTAGWKFVKENLLLTIDQLERIIISGGKDEQVLDLYRERRNCFIDLLDTPQLLIKRIKDSVGEGEGIQVDPYD